MTTLIVIGLVVWFIIWFIGQFSEDRDSYSESRPPKPMTCHHSCDGINHVYFTSGLNGSMGCRPNS